MQTRPPRRNPSAAALHPHPTGLVGTSPELPGEVRNVTYVRQASNTDIALAQLSAPVTAVSPLGLSKTRPATGSLLTIAGWGATSSTNPSPATELSTGVVKISAISSTTVNVVGYAPAADTSACLYNSGAPYFSTGPDCPHTSPETTARVDTIAKWIRTVVRDLP